MRRHDIEDTLFLDDYIMPDPDLHCMFDFEDELEGEQGYYDSEDGIDMFEMLATMLMQTAQSIQFGLS